MAVDRKDNTMDKLIENWIILAQAKDKWDTLTPKEQEIYKAKARKAWKDTSTIRERDPYYQALKDQVNPCFMVHVIPDDVADDETAQIIIDAITRKDLHRYYMQFMDRAYNEGFQTGLEMAYRTLQKQEAMKKNGKQGK